jgi:oxygen-independent coproporphyrinogen-3 oxidase
MELSEFKQYWIHKLYSMNDWPGELFCIYVANPFCVKKCKFCIYNSIELKGHSDDFKYYYNVFLPDQIKQFKDILSIRVPDTIYFGGGTASLMSPEIMENIFSLIPNFRDIKSKYIEAHPAYFSFSKLQKLIDYNFSYISFGVQTIDETILKEQGRQPFDENLQEYISLAKKHNIVVNCDLLVFLDDNLENDMRAFRRSFEYLIGILQTDIITIYPYHKKVFFKPENEIEINQNLYFISSLRKEILNIFNSYPNLKISDTNSLSLKKEDILQYNRLNYHFYRIEQEKFLEVKRYNCSGPMNLPLNQNTLAFGGYKGHIPYSYICNDKCWHTINEDWRITYKQIDCQWKT